MIRPCQWPIPTDGDTVRRSSCPVCAHVWPRASLVGCIGTRILVPQSAVPAIPPHGQSKTRYPDSVNFGLKVGEQHVRRGAGDGAAGGDRPARRWLAGPWALRPGSHRSSHRRDYDAWRTAPPMLTPLRSGYPCRRTGVRSESRWPIRWSRCRNQRSRVPRTDIP